MSVSLRDFVVESKTISTVCFIAIIPHEKLFDYYGEQMKLYLGKDVGDLLTITLNKYVPDIDYARLNRHIQQCR